MSGGIVPSQRARVRFPEIHPSARITDESGATFTAPEIEEAIQSYAGAFGEAGPAVHVLGVGPTLESNALLFAGIRSGAAVLPIDAYTASDLQIRAAQAILIPGAIYVTDPGSPLALRSEAFTRTVKRRSVPNSETRTGPGWILLLTSGTTGAPRAATLDPARFSSLLNALRERLPLTQDDVLYSPLSTSHSYGLSNMLYALRQGAHLALRRWRTFPNEIAQDLEDLGATTFAGVPTQVLTLLRGNVEALPRLRAVWSAGDAMPKNGVRDLSGRRPDVELYLMYGQTEASSRISILDPSRASLKPDSVGSPLSSLTLAIDPGHEPHTEEDLIGEIVVRGQHLMLGYWPNIDGSVDELRTGDIGYIDADGDVTILARADHLLNVGGEMVPPRLVEEIACELPDVVEAFAYQVQGSTTITVQVVLACSPPEIPVDQIRRHVNRGLRSNLIGDVEVVNEIPRTPTGKIRRIRAIDRPSDGNGK